MNTKQVVRRSFIFLLSSLIFLGLFSCKQKVKESPEPQLKYDSFSQNLATIKTSSSEFVRKIKLSQLPYLKQLVNDPYQYRDYKIDLNISAANIGLYVTDAQYLSVYDKREQAYQSAKAAQLLLQLVETKMLDTSLVQLQHGFEKKDSALFFLNDALKDTVNGLSELERKQYILSVNYGSFIEQNYILLSLLSEQGDFMNPKVAVLYQYLKKHNDQLSILLELRASFSNDDYRDYLLKDLKEYQEFYMQNNAMFGKEVSTFRQKEFVTNLLVKVAQMRNYIVYEGLLLK